MYVCVCVCVYIKCLPTYMMCLIIYIYDNYMMRLIYDKTHHVIKQALS